MAEWLKAAVLKTVSLKGDVGSNPTPSARLFKPGPSLWLAGDKGAARHTVTFQISKNCGEMAELAEGARLLSECGGKLPPRVRIPLSPPLPEGAPLVRQRGSSVGADRNGGRPAVGA